ncbi:hypothetical protein CK203_035671 [Vitis vinifera]|uniref:Retrotransposon gag domain-containing protein n=1 Tax=Vitis vinifera TaxID=29760 RepID=A0A438ICP7_VITVI|nr:hypothetical protein CK203_035671 [Vitis vinifera]
MGEGDDSASRTYMFRSSGSAYPENFCSRRGILPSTLAPSVGRTLSSQKILYLPTVKMTSPSRSRYSARGDEGYFEWRDKMETRHTISGGRIPISTRKLHSLERRAQPSRRMKHGLAKPRCTLTMYDETKVQTLLESYPSDSVRKCPKYLTQRGHAAHPLVVRVGKDSSHTAPPGSISRCLEDMLSTPFSSLIIKYEPLRGFIVPKFSTYDGSSDPFDHIMHYRQLMTLDIGNDMLLCKVFPASLQAQALSWFHRLSANSIDNFRDLSENIKMQENETLREFVKRFGQAVLQVESYNMDAILQIFKRSICPGTPFFESLAKKPPTSMDDLFRRVSKYSMLEDDIRAATHQVLVAGQAAKSEATRSFKAPNHPGSSNRE